MIKGAACARDVALVNYFNPQKLSQEAAAPSD